MQKVSPHTFAESLAYLLQTLVWISISTLLCAAPGDQDNDGLRDESETNTGILVSSSDTGTNPALADTDGDSLPDGIEMTLGTNPHDAASKVQRPNIIYILVDDLGYGDVGCFWQNQRTGIWKFATPGLDAMAAEGAMMTHHYVGAPVCAGSRASFLQGQHQGHAAARGAQFDKGLPNDHSIPSLLKSAGYKTVHLGKAGLAGTPFDSSKSSANLESHPLKRGFDEFFGYLTHADGANHYPRNGALPYKSYIHNGYTPITDAYQDLYTTDACTAYAKKTIVDETANHPERPFFIYLSFSGPHFDAQYAPTASYPQGRGMNGGVQWTGAPSYVNTAINDPGRVNNSVNRHPSVHTSWYPGAQKYVSMVRRIDESVEDILQTLRDTGVADNTLVIFTSDNGPTDKEVYPPSFQSFGPFEGLKFDLYEGGIRVPTIAWWPSKLSGTNELTNIRRISKPCANWDWMATFAEMAKVPVPAFTDGRSLLPALLGQPDGDTDRPLYFEFNYGGFVSRYPEFPNHGGETRGVMQAVRIGNHMGVRYNMTSASAPFRVYDVVADPKQSKDLALSMPELQQRMQLLAVGSRRKADGINLLYDTALIPDLPIRHSRNGILWKSYEGHWPWLPEFSELQDVAQGSASIVSPGPRSRENDVGLGFWGYLSLPTAGAYHFTLDSNSSTCMWIHEARVIDNDFNHVPSKTSAPVYLEAGLHPFRLYYRHQTGTPVLKLRYSGPGIPLQEIPASAFHVEGPPPILAADAFAVKRNTSHFADLLANDTSERPLALLSGGSNILGTSAVVSNRLRFEPFANRLGVADFSYTASDGFGEASAQVRATVLFDNERWIPFEEGSGTTVGSVGGTPRASGSFTNIADPSAAWRKGRFGKALEFDGIDDQVDFPGMILPTGATDRTISFWVRTSSRNSPENQTIFSYGSDQDGGRFKVRLANTPQIDSDQPLMLDVSGGHAIGTKPINDGQWHHVAIVTDSQDGMVSSLISDARLYVDGLPDAVSKFTEASISTGDSLVPTLGGSSHAGDFNFQGRVDDLRIFPKSLDAAEIAALHLAEPWYLSAPPESTVDSDGDGMSDSAEEFAGTDPEDRSDLLRIVGVAQAAGVITLSWSSVAGRHYQVEESEDMSTWEPVPGVDPVSMPLLAQTTDLAPPSLEVSFPHDGAVQRFYRIRVTDSP